MPLQMTGRHMNISDQLKEYIDKKMNRLRKLVPKVDQLNIIVTKENLHVEVEGLFRAGKVTATAKETGSQPYEAVDKLVDTMERQIQRAKGKRAEKKKEASREKMKDRLEVEPLVADEDAEESEEEIESEIEA